MALTGIFDVGGPGDSRGLAHDSTIQGAPRSPPLEVISSGHLTAVWREFFVRHHLALGLVCGAHFSWKLMCGAGPGDLGWSPGVGFGRNPGKTWAENLQPDCLEVPSLIQSRRSGTGGPSKTGGLVVRWRSAGRNVILVTLPDGGASPR